jgi:hypothetical protein
MFSYEPIEDRAALGQPMECANLIGTHETAIALHVCGEDSYQPPGDFRKV